MSGGSNGGAGIGGNVGQGSLLGLLPSSGTGSQNTSSHGTTAGTENVTGADTSSQVGTTSGKELTNLIFDPTAHNALNAALTDTSLNKESAIADAKAASTYAVTEALKAGMPSISGAATASGGYNSTTKDLLSNDLTAKASAAGSQVILDTIAKYQQAKATNINAATGAVTATTGKDVSTSGVNTVTGLTTTDKTTSGKQTTDQTATGSSQTGSPGAVGNLLNPQPGAGTVICTQLFLDGHIPRKTYFADIRYVDATFSEATKNGYRFWAVPFVLLMRKYSWIYAVGKYVGVRWSEHCASHILPEVKGNWLSRIITPICVPICFCIGSVIPDVRYYKLWENVR